MFLAALAWFFPMAIIIVLIFLGAMFLFFRKPPMSPSSEDTFPSEENLRAMDRLKQMTDQQLRTSKVLQRTRADIVKNIVVLGNGNVGKTTFLKRLLAPLGLDIKDDRASAKLEPTKIRKDHYVVQLIDTNNRIEYYDDLKQSIIEADFIFILFDVNSVESKQSIGRKWIPVIKAFRLKEAKLEMPKMAILANKCDCQEYSLSASDQEFLTNLDIENIAFVATCSSQNGYNIDYAFSLAYQLIFDPLEPLFDSNNAKLSNGFLHVLSELIDYFDTDRDGILSDEEMKQFSLIAWDEELKNETLNNIKTSLKQESENVSKDGITYEGLCALMKRYIIKGRRDVPWNLIRDLGYDENFNYTGFCKFQQSLEERETLSNSVS